MRKNKIQTLTFFYVFTINLITLTLTANLNIKASKIWFNRNTNPRTVRQRTSPVGKTETTHGGQRSVVWPVGFDHLRL